MKKKFCRDVLSLAFTALLFLQAPAQLKALKIGDVVPEEVWTTSLEMVNSPQKTTDLSADRDKLILLDFWAPWCSSCLANFPRIKALQEEFAEKVKIQPVTYDDAEAVEKFYGSKNGQRFKHLGSVVGDRMLKELFPHKGVPFFVWIKNGKLITTTDAEQVTAENIKKVFAGETAALQTVIQMDRARPLMLDESFDRQRNVSMLNYSIFINGAVPDIGSGGTFRYTEANKVKGRQFTNLPLSDIYFALGYELFNLHRAREYFTEKRMIIAVKDQRTLMGSKTREGMYEGKNLYSYEFIVPEDQTDSLYTYMLEDLNRYAPFTVKIEKKQVRCLVLRRTSAIDKIATKGGAYRCSFPRTPSVLRNAPIKDMVNMLNGDGFTALPVVDETGYTGKADLQVSGVTDLDQLRKELASYDLELVETTRELEMMSIKDRP